MFQKESDVMPSFNIDPEIQALLPSPAPEEDARLGVSIETDGCRDALVVIDINGSRVLGDGHSRLRHCERLGAKYRTQEIKIPSRELAIQWVIDNQLARRNLTDEQRAYYRGKEYLNKKQARGGDQRAKSHFETSLPTDEQVAKKHGVSAATVHRDADFAESVDKIREQDPPQAQAILNGQSGMTKQEIIETRPPPASKKREPRPPKNGAPVYSRKDFDAKWGALYRAIDDMTRPFGRGAKEGPRAENLRQKMVDWKREFWDLHKELTEELKKQAR
jgi:hypothetical protein